MIGKTANFTAWALDNTKMALDATKVILLTANFTATIEDALQEGVICGGGMLQPFQSPIRPLLSKCIEAEGKSLLSSGVPQDLHTATCSYRNKWGLMIARKRRKDSVEYGEHRYQVTL